MTKDAKKAAIAMATAAALALGLSACDAVQPYRDLEGAQITEPDTAYVILNADKFPNISVVCFKGVALGTTTRDTSPVTTLPASLCEGQG